MLGSSKTRLVNEREALEGRADPVLSDGIHHVLATPLQPPFPEGCETAIFALGCFWGAERLFWRLPGVHVTAVGYSGGYTPNPTYEEVCSGMTGHAEAVLVVFRPDQIPYERLLKTFWEGHDPTQGMRQGNDVGTQYRSAIFTNGQAQRDAAAASRRLYGDALRSRRFGDITTDIAHASHFYYAEAHHQQYLAKNPSGYCGLGGTGIACPIGTDTQRMRDGDGGDPASPTTSTQAPTSTLEVGTG